MKRIQHAPVVVILICAVLLAGTTVWAGGIKERMLARQPAILDLKDRGIIGETTAGYLGFVTGDQTGQEVVSAENQDRKAIYAHIAQQQNISEALVAQRRAQQLIERTSPGHYYQNAAGAWVKK